MPVRSMAMMGSFSASQSGAGAAAVIDLRLTARSAFHHVASANGSQKKHDSD